MLGDQPGVTAETVAALLAGRGGAPLALCAYDDGRAIRSPSHAACSASWPTCTATRASGDCSTGAPTRSREVPVAGPLPLDVDTPEDYRAVLERWRSMSAGAR